MAHTESVRCRTFESPAARGRASLQTAGKDEPDDAVWRLAPTGVDPRAGWGLETPAKSGLLGDDQGNGWLGELDGCGASGMRGEGEFTGNLGSPVGGFPHRLALTQLPAVSGELRQHGRRLARGMAADPEQSRAQARHEKPPSPASSGSHFVLAQEGAGLLDNWPAVCLNHDLKKQLRHHRQKTANLLVHPVSGGGPSPGHDRADA